MITKYANLIKRCTPNWLYKLAAQCYIDRTFPRHLFLETTATCNLACSYCPREKIKADMDFNLFKEIIDEASRFGNRSFSLHLFGEPLLYPRIFDAISYIKRKRRGHTVLLTTNGTLLNQKVEELISAGPDLVLWTWRKEAQFTEETKRRLRSWGRFRVRFIEEITPQEAYEEWRSWPNQETRHLHNYGNNVNLLKWQVKDDKLVTNRWSCYHLYLAPAISRDGKILICCSDPKRKSELGIFPKVSISEAWKSSNLNKIREEHLNGKYTGICEKCDVWKSYPNIFFGHEFPQK